MAKGDEGGCDSKVLDGRNARKRDEKHGCSRSSRKKISKIKKWRKEYISYAAKMRGSSRNLGKDQGGELMADERERVMELLSKFRAICKNLFEENKTQERERKVSEPVMRIDILAAREVKKMRSLYTERTNSPGPIPGVEVGDKFRYRMELILVGLHSHLQKGIDFVTNGDGERIATSVVASASGGYANETSDPNVLIYCGQGGDMVSGVQHEDQSLNNPGNYALKNSIRVKNPVRVIRGTKEKASSFETTFVYDGLYEVVEFWRDTSCSGKVLYKFKLVRITTGSS
ncbi:histone-lysine N-methyltransferase, H3 lysine-9 specific SUVH5-like [Ipomoea triloba]|uniref:histone-lysine N-methyltransferase, H3 lysine-9 specific SUVH5-like n=1 Tax=Ipomoea triloba TaxID=35885 RepID=UPI00125DFD96|nr:histone-lysine N-methyltransferase, H3 lysine-9 specific SUVH5-like [Ipomoea triloba]